VFVPEDSTIRPVQRGTVPRSAVVYPNQTNSHFTILITVLILLATLSLLGFSNYLSTVQLHLFTLPFINGQSTPTPAPSLIEVPNLNHMNWAEALKTANDAGFQLRPQPSSGTDGIVVKQSPPYPSQARGGTFIEVQMEVQKVTIPNIPLPQELHLVPTRLSSRVLALINIMLHLMDSLQNCHQIRLQR
jgi:hypothetical protein